MTYLYSMNKLIKVQDLGLKDYNESWNYQKQLFQNTLDLKLKNRREETLLHTPNHFLFVSHPHVYTLGKSGDISNLLLTQNS